MERQRRVLAEPDAAVAIKLKSNPGQWYALQAGDPSRSHTFGQVAYRIRTGRQSAFRTSVGAFEATVHTVDGTSELRARYLPDEA